MVIEVFKGGFRKTGRHHAFHNGLHNLFRRVGVHFGVERHYAAKRGLCIRITGALVNFHQRHALPLGGHSGGVTVFHDGAGWLFHIF